MKFLASPYTHPNPAVRHDRARLAHLCVEHFITDHPVFSPIAYGHPLAVRLGAELPTDARHWRALNDPILRAAEALWLLLIEGWRESAGVAHEIDVAFACEIPTYAISTAAVANSTIEGATWFSEPRPFDLEVHYAGLGG